MVVCPGEEAPVTKDVGLKRQKRSIACSGKL